MCVYECDSGGGGGASGPNTATPWPRVRPDAPAADQPFAPEPAKPQGNGRDLAALAGDLQADPIAVAAIIECHERNPKRSVNWVAKQVGALRSVARCVIEAWEATTPSDGVDSTSGMKS